MDGIGFVLLMLFTSAMKNYTKQIEDNGATENIRTPGLTKYEH